MRTILFSILILLRSILLLAQQESYTEKANNLISTFVDENAGVGIAAGFAVNNEMKWQGHSGFRDLKKEKPFDVSTETRIASIAKPMTAVAVLQLYEQGKLDLDHPIQEYLTDFPKKEEGDISIRHLLQHSSGIGSYKNKRERENKIQYANLSAAVDIFKNSPLLAKPGQEFHYTSYGYVLLGRIIEVVSGMSYEEYMQENIWNKCQMKNTGVEQEGNSLPTKSLLYHKNSRGKIKEVAATNLSDRIPAGGFYSTVPDMLKFAISVLNNELISDSTFALMVKDSQLKIEGNGYGMGWYLYGENPNYGEVYGHTGTQSGASTFLMLLPEQQTALVVLSNTSGAIQEVSNIIIQLFDLAAQSKD